MCMSQIGDMHSISSNLNHNFMSYAKLIGNEHDCASIYVVSSHNYSDCNNSILETSNWPV